VIELDFHKDLPTILEAYEKKELQCFNVPDRNWTRSCTYGGPCAIGVVIPLEWRSKLDDNDTGSDIGSLFTQNIVSAPEDQRREWEQLQDAHDKIVTTPDITFEVLEHQLKALKEKYLDA
jgi:hypothetical protein